MLFRLKFALAVIACVFLVLGSQMPSNAGVPMDMPANAGAAMDHADGCEACKQSAPSIQCSKCICNQAVVAAGDELENLRALPAVPDVMATDMAGISHRPRLRPA
jgi:hypothetical protein